MNKMKTYVLMLSREFPSTHPKHGEPTDFKTKREVGIKKHTIRQNAMLWELRADEINAGRAVLSIRQWSGKPYEKGSHQIEVARLSRVGVQHVSFEYEWHPVLQVYLPASTLEVYNEDFETKEIATATVATNDGLSLVDFRHWFACRSVSYPPARFHGIILHFTDMRY